MTHKLCLSAAAFLALLLALPAPALAYDGATPDQPNRLSAGLSHTAYVDGNGTLWTWGSNQAGQLGAETQETDWDREGNQVTVSGTALAVLEDVRSVAAGGDFTIALKTDGTLWAWGGNDYGQLGNGTTAPSSQPVQVLDQVTAVSAGDYHVAAIRADGTLWTWGDDLYGQLGDGSLDSVSVPHQVLDNVTAVSAGANATAAVRSDGTLWTWGDNLFGQLGDGTRDSVSAPHQVLTDVRFAVMGDYHAAAISTDGTLYTWGSNLDGQLGTGGLGDTMDEDTGAVLQLTPAAVSLSAPVSAVTVGAGHTAAILTDGTLWTWGRNDAMQLGLTNTGAQVLEPEQIVELVPAQAVSAGTDQTVCLLTDGEVLAWGSPAMGQLGSGTPQAKAAEPEVQAEEADAGAVSVDLPSQKTASWVPLVVLAVSGAVVVIAGVVTRRH